jgi:hypothetical protein
VGGPATESLRKPNNIVRQCNRTIIKKYAAQNL